jgi:hypothetical protein
MLSTIAPASHTVLHSSAASTLSLSRPNSANHLLVGSAQAIHQQAKAHAPTTTPQSFLKARLQALYLSLAGVFKAMVTSIAHTLENRSWLSKMRHALNLAQNSQ